MEFTPQQKGAIEAFYDRLLRVIRDAIEDVDFSVELQEMEKTGVSLQQINLTLLVNRLGVKHAPAKGQSDAEFLRSLRIDPDLNVDTEAR